NGGPLSVAGASNINAGANAITLTRSEERRVGTDTITGGTVSVTDANALTAVLATSGPTTLTSGANGAAGGNLTVSGTTTGAGANLSTTTTAGTGGTTTFGATSVGGNLATTSAGAVSGGPLSVAGASNINAGANAITLT